MIRLVLVALVLAMAPPARAQECGDFPLPPCTCGDFPLPPCDATCGAFPLPPCGTGCGGPGQPACTCGAFPLPPCDATCGVPGTPPCIPTCGTEDTPLCPTCGTPTTPPCPEPTCGVEGLPDCEEPICGLPGLPECCDLPGYPVCETEITCGIANLPPCPTCPDNGPNACICDLPGKPACLSPPVARCGETGLPACVEQCLESLSVPECATSGGGLCLAHRWTFDESGRTVLDSVGTIHGAMSRMAERTDGLDGTALLLPPRYDSSVSFAGPHPAFGTANFTISAWVRISLDNPSSSIVEIGGVRMGLQAGRPTVRLGSITYTSALPLTHSRWNHVALVRSGTTHLLFVNGYVTDAVSSTAVLDILAGPQNFGAFQGVLEDVRIHDGALSPEQVRREAAGLCASTAG